MEQSLTHLNLANTEIAFKNQSDHELKTALNVFRLFNNQALVKLGPRLAGFAVRIRLPMRPLVHSSLFKQFCGGETIPDCLPKVKELAGRGVGTILDYATEHMTKETDFEQTTDEMIKNIAFAASNPSVPFCVFKPTGLVRFALLEKLGRKESLTAAEQGEWQRGQLRFERICQKAFEVGAAVMIDAEESWVQDPVDNLVLNLMRRFNRDRPIVYNTLQFYRYDRLFYLKELYALAMEEDFFLGFKLVRGAYMEKERKRAQNLSYSSPIHATKAQTDEAFDKAVAFCVKNIAKIGFCVGTHNEKSTLLTAKMVDDHGIRRNHPHLAFAQLLGMSDNLTFNLAHCGFNAAKYVPYGKLGQLLPYLSRRAEENSSILNQSNRELELIKRELQRRGVNK